MKSSPSVKLFLDDRRVPTEAIALTSKDLTTLYSKKDWNIVRTYKQFVDWIRVNGLPDLISFDYDLIEIDPKEKARNYDMFLGIDHHVYSKKTGLECAKWLVDYCRKNKLKLPEYIVHSANPYGRFLIKKQLVYAKSKYKL